MERTEHVTNFGSVNEAHELSRSVGSYDWEALDIR